MRLFLCLPEIDPPSGSVRDCHAGAIIRRERIITTEGLHERQRGVGQEALSNKLPASQLNWVFR